MKLSREELLHLAKLASLPLTDAELATFERDLGNIVGHVETVLTATASSASPQSEPTVVDDAGGSTLASLRDDVGEPGLSHEDALAAAPETADGGFSVPTFVSG